MDAGRQINVLIVDDHLAIAQSIGGYLEEQDDITVVDIFTSGQAALQKMGSSEQSDVDVVLMDFQLSDTDGDQVTSDLLRVRPDVFVLAMTQYEDQEVVRRMSDAGVRGFISKGDALSRVPEAIRSVFSGSCWFSAEILDIVKQAPPPRPTGQEMNIILLWSFDYSASQTAALLGLTKYVVDRTRRRFKYMHRLCGLGEVTSWLIERHYRKAADSVSDHFTPDVLNKVRPPLPPDDPG